MRRFNRRSRSNALTTAFVSLLTLGVGACDIGTVVNSGAVSATGNTICIWVAADKDAYVATGRVGEEANSNFGHNGSLAVASGPLGRKQSYVHFTPPTLPEGSQVIEARLELYNGARNGDGTSDDINIAVGRVSDAWNPSTITWNNQPFNSGFPLAEATLRLRSDAWCGTGDIAGIVREMLADPQKNEGFFLWYQDPGGRQVDKGFYSDNDFRRKRNALGLSPRLLMRVQLPAGASMLDLRLGFLIPDHDLERLGSEITMDSVVTASTWPAHWNVTGE
jgi:hypothetical protein